MLLDLCFYTPEGWEYIGAIPEYSVDKNKLQHILRIEYYAAWVINHHYFGMLYTLWCDCSRK